MSDMVYIYAIVEGKTEQEFINQVLAPYLQIKNIYLTPIQITKKGQKGGDVKFSRVINDVKSYIGQSHITAITTFVDYYGLKEWPGLSEINHSMGHTQIARLLNDRAKAEVLALYPNSQVKFIPYMAMYEFEALLFSDVNILALNLGVDENEVSKIVQTCTEPEQINNSRETAPSKRLNQLNIDGQFRKTTQGIAIAKAIGIDHIRQHCPLFNQWVDELECCASFGSIH